MMSAVSFSVPSSSLVFQLAGNPLTGQVNVPPSFSALRSLGLMSLLVADGAFELVPFEPELLLLFPHADSTSPNARTVAIIERRVRLTGVPLRQDALAGRAYVLTRLEWRHCSRPLATWCPGRQPVWFPPAGAWLPAWPATADRWLRVPRR